MPPTPFLIPRSIATSSLNISNTSSLGFESDPTTGLQQTSDGSVEILVQGNTVATVSGSAITCVGNIQVSEGRFISGNGYTLSGIVDTTPLPTISNVIITDDSWSPTQIQVLTPNSSNVHCIIEGTNFRPATSVQINDISSPYVSFQDASTLLVKPPAFPYGTYPVNIIRPDGKIASSAITYSPYPVWATASDLGNVYYDVPFSLSLVATEASQSLLSYTVTGGTLPFGTNLSSNTGVYSGTLTSPKFTNMVFSFDVTVTDSEQQEASRTFTVHYVGLYESIRHIDGLVGWYDGDSWDTVSWIDKSGQNNHVAVSGVVTQGSLGGFSTLIGTTSTTFLWPTSILPEQYTLFHVCRYAGNTKRRIMNGSGVNWLSGFHNTNVGVAYHNVWITSSLGILPTDDWVMSTDQLSVYRGNERNFVTTFSGTPSAARLAINTGTSETSDFEVAEVIVYNREISFDDIQYVEYYLSQKYGLITIESLRQTALENLPTGTYSTLHGPLYLLNTGTEVWALVGVGREGFNFTDSGNGTLSDIVSFRDGNTPYWMSSLFVRTIMDSVYWQESSDGVMVQRFNVNDAWRYRLTSTSVQFNWSLFLQRPNSYSAVVQRYSDVEWWTEGLTVYQSNPITSWTDISFDGNNETRCFTWQWSGHNNARGFSAGSTVTDGYQYATERHAIQRVNVYARLK